MEELISKVKEIRKEQETGEKAIRYHITQLMQKGILVRNKGKYSFYLNPENQTRDLGEALESLYLQNAKNSFQNIRQALKLIVR